MSIPINLLARNVIQVLTNKLEVENNIDQIKESLTAHDPGLKVKYFAIPQVNVSLLHCEGKSNNQQKLYSALCLPNAGAKNKSQW